jgi:hypothetical protein
VWVDAALVVCYVGHALPLTGGLAGIGAALGGLAGNPVHLVVATVVLAVTATVVLAQARRRRDAATVPPRPAGWARQARHR